MHVRMFGECFGRFTTRVERGGLTLRIVWWQFGRRILRERSTVVAWPLPTLPTP